jgi:hypothetical protein
MRATTGGWGLAIVLAAAWGVAGCGDDDSGTDDAGRDDVAVDDGRDAAEDAGEEGTAEDAGETTGEDGGGGTGTLALQVIEYGDWPDLAEIPVGDVTVALDEPGGGRTELTTDAEGRVTFEGLDWSLGTAATTLYKDGYALASRVGIEEQAEELKLSIYAMEEVPPPEFVELSGTATMADPTHTLTVSATIPNEIFSLEGPAWTLPVMPGLEFTLIGVESSFNSTTGREIDRTIHGWLMADHAAVTAATTVALDFTTPAAATTVSGSFTLPSRADSRLRTAGYGLVSVYSDNYYTGLIGNSTHSDVSGDGNSIAYDVEYVQPAGAEPMTVFFVVTGDEFSRAMVGGYPTAGAHDAGLLDLPLLTVPATMSTRHPLHDPMQWQLFDTDVRVLVYLFRDEQTVWTVRGPDDATTIAIPDPPAGVDTTALLGTGLLEGTLYILQRDPTDTFTQKMAGGRTILLEQ